jgi:hypothetical protein
MAFERRRSERFQGFYTGIMALFLRISIDGTMNYEE